MGNRLMKGKLFLHHKLSSSLKKIKKNLKNLQPSPISEEQLSTEEQDIIDFVKKETAQLNSNNITRTQGYLDFYRQFPEIHWAFLGHMVSRNGGWNMTDLKGDFLPKILSVDEQQNFFTFLERGNWLIFHDIYPQLLLYQESIRRNTNLFYLLPAIGVSRFMEVIWNHFWEESDEYLLAIALVINEQSYLEKRVVQQPHYQKTVFNTLEFKLQDLLSLNQILFPCSEGDKIKIRGQTIHHFASLHERILLGIRLYKLLFEEGNFAAFYKWALQHPHTGSRRDYWPMLFNDINESIPGKPIKRRTRKCRLKPGSHRIYSPQLKYSWKNVEHKQAEEGDWYSTWQIVRYLKKDTQFVDGNIQDEYCYTLEKLEFSILAKQSITP